MIKILFVESVDDDITKRRHRLLASDSRLAAYELHYFYAIALTVQQQAILSAGVAPDLTLDDKELATRLDDAIQQIQPHFVLLHTGFVFRRFPSAFFKVFAQLKERHLSCQFGLQAREGLVVDPTAFHQTEEVMKLQHLIFKEILGL